MFGGFAHRRKALAGYASRQSRPSSILTGSSIPRPWRCQHQNTGIDRTVRLMRAGQKAQAHQKFTDDEATGEAEILPEQPRPLIGRAGMMRFEPAVERTMRASHFLDPAGIGNRRLDLLP